jgi:Carboxypeptidase regulatory-like domain
MSYRAIALLSLVLACVLALAPTGVSAQAVSTGTVVGQITDPSGASVAGAAIVLTDLSTRSSRSVTSNQDGRYIMVDVPPATYEMTVTQKGFRVAKISKQTVTVGTQLTLNVSLQLGVATEVVEVTASSGAELQTLNSTVGTSFSGVALDSLPAITREASTFAMLQPGVSPEGSVAGAVMDQNTFQLDGGQNTNDMDGSMSVYTPSFASDPSGVSNFEFGGLSTGVLPTPIDSIEEFKVGTTQQTADFNSSAGAQVSMVTRRGHDAWHGTAYEYYLDNNFNANSFTNNAPSTRAALPSYHYNRFGGSVGGAIIPKKILGGKTYFFGNYEGFRYPNSATIERLTPGPGMRIGLLAAGTTVYNLNPTATVYPSSAPALGALVPGTTYQSGATTGGVLQANCLTAIAGASCDPRNLGISPTLSALWAGMPNAPASTLNQRCGGVCDGVNVLGVPGNLGLQQRSDFAVARIDHDFGDKEHFFSSYRFYRLTRATNNQTELASDGTITSLANRPQIPWFLAAGLTSNLTSNFTNDFHYSYLRNWWLWGTQGGPPQTCGGNAACAGLGAALEPNGETATGVLAPYNVNTQSIRERYWDGQDHMIRDDMTRLIGNHILQWGGIYQHNYNQHARTDNGGGVNNYPVYQLGNGNSGGNGTNMTGYVPTIATGGAGINSKTNWSKLYGDVLGLLAVDQVVYTRSGPQLTLNVTPPGQPPANVTDRVHIPYYNTYFTDSWHIRPSVTLTYGLAWTLEMPPVEENGEQVELVDSANQVINVQQFLNTTKKQALIGQSYGPQLGFTLVGNAGGGLKYPYNPYYGEFSPRLAVAWSPSYDHGILGSVMGRNKTVVRGGFSLIYGRLNGVDLVLVPLLGTGLLQPVQCFNPLISGACGGLTPTGTPVNSFRIGVDGKVGPLPAASTTLPQPYFPGISQVVLPSGATVTAPEAGASESLDQAFRPNKSYEMNFTIQRQLAKGTTVEVGYIGRVIRNEYQPINLNAVPYMFTEGGQTFADAFGKLTMQYCGGNAGLAGGNCTGTATVTPQPFFETALGGTGSAYCTGFASCTAAVAAKEGNAGTGNLSQQFVWSLWSDLDNGAFIFPHTMQNTGPTPQLSSGVADNTSLGFGNYNALFVSTRTSDWHGLTAQSNFTYSHALGLAAQVQASSELTAADPFFLARGYGNQSFDRKFVFNTFLVYQPPYYKSQQGVIGHLLGGWTISPIFVTGSGLPLYYAPQSFVSSPYFGGQEFGSADSSSYGAYIQAVNIGGPGCSNFGTTSHTVNSAASGVGTYSYNLNLFSNPAQVLNCFRNPVLGVDTGHNGAAGSVLRGMPFWNVDMQIRKTTRITERFSAEFQVVFANLFNHNQMADPGTMCGINCDPADFGSVEAQANAPRAFEFGFRLRF